MPSARCAGAWRGFTATAIRSDATEPAKSPLAYCWRPLRYAPSASRGGGGGGGGGGSAYGSIGPDGTVLRAFFFGAAFFGVRTATFFAGGSASGGGSTAATVG